MKMTKSPLRCHSCTQTPARACRCDQTELPGQPPKGHKQAHVALFAVEIALQLDRRDEQRILCFHRYLVSSMAYVHIAAYSITPAIKNGGNKENQVFERLPKASMSRCTQRLIVIKEGQCIFLFLRSLHGIKLDAHIRQQILTKGFFAWGYRIN